MTMTDTGLRRVSFTVAGLPSTQGSKKQVPHRHTGEMMLLEQSGKKLTDWRAVVRAEAYKLMLGQPIGAARMALQGPIGISLAFTLPRPPSAPRSRVWPCVKRDDLDKLVRAVLDAITGPVLADDGQVVQLEASKSYPVPYSARMAGPGVIVEAWQIGEDS